MSVSCCLCICTLPQSIGINEEKNYKINLNNNTVEWELLSYKMTFRRHGKLRKVVLVGQSHLRNP